MCEVMITSPSAVVRKYNFYDMRAKNVALTVALTQDYVLNPFIRNLIPKRRGTKSTVKQSQVQTLV